MSAMAPAVLLLFALASGLLALALWLFASARRRKAQQAIESTLQRSLEIRREWQAAAPPGLPGMPAAPTLAARPQGRSEMLRRLKDRLRWKAWGMAPRTLGLLAVAALALALGAALQGGALAGALTLALCLPLGSFGIWLRLSRRRARILGQLPGFLDNLVRLLSIGNSLPAAFQFASANVPQPLGGALQQASAGLNVSPDLGQAMAQLERTWGLAEFGLLAAVFRMSTRYGGRADMVLERVSSYIRDRQSAERELHAMSAEVRMSAWILALLPVVVGAMIMLLNEGYFLRMWHDSAGRQMVFMAAGLQVCGSLLLYRLARLR
ncbi:type II secretion system F family protein [Comamonas endophytica]|uniref:Type II secretion system F family protein n=1 Tax=Comamonas endophytica TaxID=2949090 RepID=A0ABY6GC91_9BURK|nr:MULTISPECIES: type II secretion system F family protein [unclassified Acidovorax]MCD2512152.1 type II secretion system F family protein [Acidovorax sp. D4N7]UYG51925.1 type II secretion system F family protein [Acidovorax sp. 5MLIR]